MCAPAHPKESTPESKRIKAIARRNEKFAMQQLDALASCPAMLPPAAQHFNHLPVSRARGAKLSEVLIRAVKLLQGRAGQGEWALARARKWLLGEGLGALLSQAAGGRRATSRHPWGTWSCRAQQKEGLTLYKDPAEARLHSATVIVSHINVSGRVNLCIKWGIDLAISCKAVTQGALRSIGSTVAAFSPELPEVENSVKQVRTIKARIP